MDDHEKCQIGFIRVYTKVSICYSSIKKPGLLSRCNEILIQLAFGNPLKKKTKVVYTIYDFKSFDTLSVTMEYVCIADY